MPARVSGLSYTLEKAWHLKVLEDGQDVGGAFFDHCSEGRREAEHLGQLWLRHRRVADDRTT